MIVKLDELKNQLGNIDINSITQLDTNKVYIIELSPSLPSEVYIKHARALQEILRNAHINAIFTHDILSKVYEFDKGTIAYEDS